MNSETFSILQSGGQGFPVTQAYLKWDVAIEGIAALVDKKTFEIDRGGNGQRWDSAESAKAD